MTEVVLIVAVADNGVMGNKGGMPWHIPADLKRFKALTMGKPMLMGRKTWDSIGRPLPGRRSLVLTRDEAWEAEGAERVGSVEEAMGLSIAAEELMVIGGADLLRIAEPFASRIELTRVHARPEGDVVWQPPATGWREELLDQLPATANAPACDFVRLTRAG